MKLTAVTLAVYRLMNGADMYELKPFVVRKFIGEK